MTHDPVEQDLRASAAGALLPAIVVAAGVSSRMGEPKPLLPWRGRPMIVHVVEMLASAGAAPVIVVLGHEAEKVRSILTAQAVASIENFEYKTGEMLSSVQAGARALPNDAEAFLVALADQPAVRRETVRAIIDAWHRSRAPIVAPRFEDQRGHPIVLSARLIPELLELNAKAGQTLKDLIRQHEHERLIVPVDDPAVAQDVDTPEQYQRALDRFAADEAS